MKYPNAKKGLNLLVTAFIIDLIAAIVTGITNSFLSSTTVGNILVIICNVATVVVAIMCLVAYAQAGKDSASFKNAFQVEIFGLVLPIVCVIVATIAYAFNADWSDVVANIITYVDIAVEIWVFYYVCKGCTEVCDDEGVTKTSKTAIVWYAIANFAAIIFGVIASIALSNSNGVLAAISLVLLVVSAVANVVSSIIQIVLIFKARTLCK